MKLPAELREALAKTGLPWEIENGKKHNKIKLAGKLVGVYPHGKANGDHKRSLLNTITQVRRAAQELTTK